MAKKHTHMARAIEQSAHPQRKESKEPFNLSSKKHRKNSNSPTQRHSRMRQHYRRSKPKASKCPQAGVQNTLNPQKNNEMSLRRPTPNATHAQRTENAARRPHLLLRITAVADGSTWQWPRSPAGTMAVMCRGVHIPHARPNCHRIASVFLSPLAASAMLPCPRAANIGP